MTRQSIPSLRLRSIPRAISLPPSPLNLRARARQSIPSPRTPPSISAPSPRSCSCRYSIAAGDHSTSEPSRRHAGRRRCKSHSLGQQDDVQGRCRGSKERGHADVRLSSSSPAPSPLRSPPLPPPRTRGVRRRRCCLACSTAFRLSRPMLRTRGATMMTHRSPHLLLLACSLAFAFTADATDTRSEDATLPPIPRRRCGREERRRVGARLSVASGLW